jgi:uncharacterized protein (DUF983 family)
VKEFAVYTLARFGVFLASYAVVAGLWMLLTGELPLFLPLLVAVVISGIASVYLLRGLRGRFAAVVERRAAAASQRFEEIRAKEDAD